MECHRENRTVEQYIEWQKNGTEGQVNRMRLIDGDKLYDWVKTECNPYGKPTIDFESGNRMLDIIKRMSTAFDKGKVIAELVNLRQKEYHDDDCEELLDGEEIYDEGRSQGRFEAYHKAIEIVEKGGIEQ
ncbi:hypothetical protein AXF09_11045 [Ruminococcus sp. DSM 100440]|nr:hypothetical protein AXF09_11045 [Ruminococcus sp. DSM 100440]